MWPCWGSSTTPRQPCQRCAFARSTPIIRAVKATDIRPIGRTSLHVTRLGLGGVFLASDAPRAEAEALIDRAAELGVRYFDTAPMYGVGESERRYRQPLAGLERSGFVLSTKVGRVLREDVGGARALALRLLPAMASCAASRPASSGSASSASTSCSCTIPTTTPTRPSARPSPP